LTREIDGYMAGARLYAKLQPYNRRFDDGSPRSKSTRTSRQFRWHVLPHWVTRDRGSRAFRLPATGNDAQRMGESVDIAADDITHRVTTGSLRACDRVASVAQEPHDRYLG